ncbi:MAG: hypothetical protein VX892_02615 [Candidatus Thermoplasmatota archaeon]|nr:hypothetical protein [Candidatus Thermoplasmatota archaeon]
MTPVVMRSDLYLVLLLAALLILPSSIMAAPVEVDDSLGLQSPGRIIDAVVLDINGTEGNGENSRRAPLVIELHTATWCDPCRPAEVELNELLNVWPNLIALHHHSSAFDPLSIEASNQTKISQHVLGYPTLVIDGRWSLNGSNQSQDLFGLVAEITSKGGTRSSAPSDIIIGNWSINETIISVDINVSSPTLQVDVFYVVDGVYHAPLGLLSDVVVAGKVDINSNSTINISLNGSRISSIEDNGQLVVVARNRGDVQLVSGSDRMLYDGFQLTPNNSTPRSLFEETTWLVWLILLGGVAALLPALQHTFPLLWSKRKSDEEE